MALSTPCHSNPAEAATPQIFRSAAGDYYACYLNYSYQWCKVYKISDPCSGTWVEQDSSNRPSGTYTLDGDDYANWWGGDANISYSSEDDRIHFCWTVEYNAGPFYAPIYACFDPATDTWTIDENPDLAYGHVRYRGNVALGRSDGSIVVLGHAPTSSGIMGTKYARAHLWTRSSGGTWTAEGYLDADTSTASNRYSDIRGGIVQDRVHAWMLTDVNNPTLVTIRSDDTWAKATATAAKRLTKWNAHSWYPYIDVSTGYLVYLVGEDDVCQLESSDTPVESTDATVLIDGSVDMGVAYDLKWVASVGGDADFYVGTENGSLLHAWPYESGTLGDSEQLENVFDVRHDGWAELVGGNPVCWEYDTPDMWNYALGTSADVFITGAVNNPSPQIATGALRIKLSIAGAVNNPSPQIATGLILLNPSSLGMSFSYSMVGAPEQREAVHYVIKIGQVEYSATMIRIDKGLDRNGYGYTTITAQLVGVSYADFSSQYGTLVEVFEVVLLAGGTIKSNLLGSTYLDGAKDIVLLGSHPGVNLTASATLITLDSPTTRSVNKVLYVSGTQSRTVVRMPIRGNLEPGDYVQTPTISITINKVVISLTAGNQSFMEVHSG